MILDSVKRIINEQLGVNENDITLDSAFVEDLGADSLDLVEFVMAFESEFDIEIDEDDVEKISTVRDAVKYLQDHTDME